MVFCLLILACLFRIASTISEVADTATNRVWHSSTLGNTAISSAKALHGAASISTTILDPYAYVFGITQVSPDHQGMIEASATAFRLEVHHSSHNELPHTDAEAYAPKHELLLSSGRRLFSGGPGPVIIYSGQPITRTLHTQTFQTTITVTGESSAVTQMPSTSSTMGQSVSTQASLTPTSTAQSLSETSIQTPSSTNTSITAPSSIVEGKSHSQRQVIVGATTAALVLSGSIVSSLLLRHLRRRRRHINAGVILSPYTMYQEQRRSLRPQSLGVHTGENDERFRSDNMQWLSLIAVNVPNQTSMDERTNDSSARKHFMGSNNQPRDSELTINVTPDRRSRNSSGTSATTPPPSYRSEPDS